MSALDAALAYAGLGWRVIPIWGVLADGSCACGDPECAPGGESERNVGKHPCGALAPSGQDDSTTDEATIRRWFEDYPAEGDLNIAVDLLRSGLMALDVDDPNGRDAAIEKLHAAMAKYGTLPNTVEQVSGSGNGHLFYRRPDFPIRGVLDGITVRGRNYCVVAPSLHRSGRRYEWEEGRGPGEVEVAALPPNWLAALRKPDPVGDVGVPDQASEPAWLQAVPHDKRVADMREHLAKEKGEVMGVDRAGTTWDVIRTSARGYAVRDPAAVLTALLEVYNPKCQPPYSESGLVDRLTKAYDQAHSPEWGANYEPVANKLVAFYQDVLGTAYDPAVPPPPVLPGPGEAPTLEFVLAELRAVERRAARSTNGREVVVGQLLKEVRERDVFTDDDRLDVAVRVVVDRAPAGTTPEQFFAVLGHAAAPDQVRALIETASTKKREHQEAMARPPEDDDELRERLAMADDGPRSTPPNVAKILRYSETTRGRLKYDVITKEVTCDAPALLGRPESLVTRLRIWLEEEWGVSAKERDVGQVVEMVAKDTGEWNSVAEYLRGCGEWDGVRRLDTWLFDYCGAESKDRDGSDITQYVRDVGAMWMISAVARAVAPEDDPAKVDTVLVLEGKQSAGKSSTFEALGGAWFTDTGIVIGDKDSRMVAGRRWICELAELASLARSAVEAHKAFLSARADFYRPPYGHVPYSVARRCVFGGTVNPDVAGEVTYLQDDTGNRRWWPVRVGECDVRRLLEDRDQLWAEAYHRYLRADVRPERAHWACPGERWWFERHEQPVADRVAEQRRPVDTWQDSISEWAHKQVAGVNGVRRDRWTLEEVAEGALGIEVKDLPRQQRQVTAALTGAGFRSQRSVRPGDTRRRRYWGHPDLSVAPPEARVRN